MVLKEQRKNHCKQDSSCMLRSSHHELCSTLEHRRKKCMFEKIPPYFFLWILTEKQPTGPLHPQEFPAHRGRSSSHSWGTWKGKHQAEHSWSCTQTAILHWSASHRWLYRLLRHTNTNMDPISKTEISMKDLKIDMDIILCMHIVYGVPKVKMRMLK